MREFEQSFYERLNEVHSRAHKRAGEVLTTLTDTIALGLSAIVLTGTLIVSQAPIALPRSEEVRNQPTRDGAPRAEWLSGALRKIRELRKLQKNWNGYGAPAPSADAANNAKTILQYAHSHSLEPDRIVPSAEGGIGLYWFGRQVLDGGAHRRYAWIECDNENGMAVVTCDRLQGDDAGAAWDFDLKDVDRAIDAVRDFIKVA